MTANTVQPSRMRPVIFSLLTLLSGIVIGAGATLILVGPPEEAGAVPPLPEEASRRMVFYLTRELGLTEEQQQQIRQVVETHMTVLDQMREEARPKIRQELDTMNTEIMDLLDNNQQQMWKERIEQMHRRFREARERRGPRDGDRRGRDDRNRFNRGPGMGPGPDPNSPDFRRRPPEGMRRGRFGPGPDRQRPDRMADPNQPPKEMPV